MNIRRTLPPAASPLTWKDLTRGIRGLFDPEVLEKIGKEFKDYFGAKHVFFVSSGKAALVVILQALKAGSSRRKVVVPAYICYSVPSAVIKAGLDVVPCDIDESTLDYDFNQLSELVDGNTLCVIPNHLFGVPSDIGRVREICEAVGAYVVEDAAQAMGMKVAGKSLGTMGDAGFFSFGRGKNITCLSGGLILTSSDEIAGRIEREWSLLEEEPWGIRFLAIFEAVFMIVFIHPWLYWFPAGLPFLGLGDTKYYVDIPIHRLGTFKAGLLRGWRSRLETFNRHRAGMSLRYMDSFGLMNRIPLYSDGIPFLRFPVFAADPETRKDLCRRGHRMGISPMYPDTIANLAPVRGNKGEHGCKSAERVAKTLLTLPTHVLLRDRDHAEVCDLVRGRVMGWKSVRPLS